MTESGEDPITKIILTATIEPGSDAEVVNQDTLPVELGNNFGMGAVIQTVQLTPTVSQVYFSLASPPFEERVQIRSCSADLSLSFQPDVSLYEPNVIGTIQLIIKRIGQTVLTSDITMIKNRLVPNYIPINDFQDIRCMNGPRSSGCQVDYHLQASKPFIISRGDSVAILIRYLNPSASRYKSQGELIVRPFWGTCVLRYNYSNKKILS
jgi:hypothetical protein